MQSHHGLHGIGNKNTNNHQAQFGRLWSPIFLVSIQFTSMYYVRLIPEIRKLSHRQSSAPADRRRPGLRGLKLGVFGVGWMGEPGAVSGVAGWGMLVRFGAGGGPPARGVFLDFAHFGAAAVGVGFGARAVADR